ncbi:MAG TPA: hypothetical protein GXZ82_05855 [Firmicutes bacterium]|nr:hypothetical protein [Bacillota bacterium]
MEGFLRRFSLPHQLLFIANCVYSFYVILIFLRYVRLPECRLLGDLPSCIILLFSTYPVWCLAVYVTNLLIKAYQRHSVTHRYLWRSTTYRRWYSINLFVLMLWSVSSWIWAFIWTYAAFALLAVA